MELAILILGFIGSWLLFAGPIWQAALELGEENVDFDRDSFKDLAKANPVSVWWWFLPPVKIYLEQRRSKRIREEFLKSLPSKTVEQFMSFMNKATAWMYVGSGGLLIAIKETYELNEYLGWGMWIFWLAVMVLFFASVMNVITRFRRTKDVTRR